MSNMVVRTNMLALNSHRNLGMVSSAQQRAAARLSSGFRINSGADDAAGLGISENMRAQIRGLDMASRNAQDGISLVQTAEGGLSTINDMIIRIRELTVQAANDINTTEGAGNLGTNESNRARIQGEINHLIDEIQRTATTLQFNSMTLLDGSMSGGGIAAMSDEVRALVDGFLAGTGSIPFAALEAAQDALETATELRDAYQAAIDGLMALQAQIASATSAAGLAAAVTGVQAAWQAHVNNGAPATVIGGVVVAAGSGSQEQADFLAGFLNNHFNGLFPGLNLGLAAGDIDETVLDAFTPSGIAGLTAANLALNTIWTAGDWDTNVRNVLTTQMTAVGTPVGDLLDAAPTGAPVTTFAGIAGMLTTLGTGLTTQNTAMATQQGLINAAILDLNQALLNAETAGTAPYAGLLEMFGDFTTMMEAYDAEPVGGGLWLQIGANSEQGIFVEMPDIVTYAANVLREIFGSPDFGAVTNDSSVGSVAEGTGVTITELIDQTDAVLAVATAARGALGAIQNRLEFTIQNLDVSSENLSASNSRIRDADMALEMMRLTQANVLQQAATAMLAQGNQAPQSILQLLG